MYDLYKYAHECMTELDSIGINYNKNVSFTINTKALRRLGLCTLHKNTYSIQISSILLDEENPVMALKNTIMHELLHTVPDCMNHGALWQCLANRVNKTLGYTVSRVADYKTLGIVKNNLKETAGQNAYVFKCEKCDQKIIRYRNSKFVRHYNEYRCGICGGVFTPCDLKI